MQADRHFNFPAFASLVLCVLSFGLWARTIWSSDSILVRTRSHWVSLGWIEGDIELGVMEDLPPAPMSWQYMTANPDLPLWRLGEAGARRSTALVGFREFHGPVIIVPGASESPNVGAFGFIPPGWRFGVPLWFFSLIFAAYPAILLRRQFVAAKRMASSHCAFCGYDLRASPERCPECGNGAVSIETAASEKWRQSPIFSRVMDCLFRE